MRNRSITLFALILVAATAAGRKAEAQVLRGAFRGPRVFAGAGGPVTLTPGYGQAYAPTGFSPASASGYVPPYSYFAAPPGQPARIYEGPTGYPYYGKPYGHPYDRWTWPYKSGAPDANLERYYYPPLG